MPQQSVYRKDISIFLVPLITLGLVYLSVMEVFDIFATHYCTGWTEALGTGSTCSIPWLATYANAGFNFMLADTFSAMPTAGLGLVSILSGFYWYKRIRKWKGDSAPTRLLAWGGLTFSVISGAIFIGLFFYLRMGV